MQRFVLRAEVHRATVTRADLHHVGSPTTARDLVDAADPLPGHHG